MVGARWQEIAKMLKNKRRCLDYIRRWPTLKQLLTLDPAKGDPPPKLADPTLEKGYWNINLEWLEHLYDRLE